MWLYLFATRGCAPCGRGTCIVIGEDFIENQQKQLNSYIQRLGGIDIRLWRVKKERRKKIDKLTTYRI